jgi:peptidyl-prolyl cis-trans isomerase D
MRLRRKNAGGHIYKGLTRQAIRGNNLIFYTEFNILKAKNHTRGYKMLDAMRRSARSLGMKFVLMLIVLTFVFMGAGSFMSRSPGEIATVNDEPITIEEFQRTYADIIENLRRQFGGNIDDEFLRMINVERQALDSLIDKKLLLQVADEKSLSVPDEALVDAIARMPAFQTAGRFDQEKYNLLLRQNRLSHKQFETMHKETILARQVQNFIVNTVAVSETEARAWFEWENTKIDVEYVTFSPEDFQDIEVSEDDIASYYEENKEKYRNPASIKARYIRFDSEKFVSAARVSDEEIATFYARNESEYKTPETATASHILIRMPENPDPEMIEEKRGKAFEIYEKAISGEDFSELARTYSDCPSSEDGGRLGSFSRQDMVAPFSEKVFSLEPGEIGEPVRTRFGWHVIRLEDYQPASVMPLASVENDIRKQLARQKAGDIAYERAMEMYDISFDGDDLLENAERFGYEVETTDFFTRAEGPENIEQSTVFANKAFELPIGQISDILTINGAYYLLQPMEIKEAAIPDLSAVKADVKKDVAEEKRIRAAQDAAETFLENARKDGSFIDAAQNAGRTIASTDFFTRNDQIPGIGQTPEFIKAAFDIREINGIHDSVINIADRFFVIRLAGQKVPEESEFEEKKDRIKTRMVARKQQETFENWMAALRKNSEIQISDRFAQQFN